jgi:hypothetical protein
MDDETLRELAKASRALAKTTGKGIDAARDFGGWLNKVFGRAIVNTVDLLWTDRIETLRVRAAIYDAKKLSCWRAEWRARRLSERMSAY